MSSQLESYIIALALIEHNQDRSMPLGGKSLKADDLNDEKTLELYGRELVEQLLIRIIQKSETGLIRRVGGDKSLILIEIGIEHMQGQIPLLKSNWINTGDNNKFFKDLLGICNNIWSVSFKKGEGVNYTKIS